MNINNIYNEKGQPLQKMIEEYILTYYNLDMENNYEYN